MKNNDINIVAYIENDITIKGFKNQLIQALINIILTQKML
jgi:hypothetical protein